MGLQFRLQALRLAARFLMSVTKLVRVLTIFFSYNLLINMDSSHNL